MVKTGNFRKTEFLITLLFIFTLFITLSIPQSVSANYWDGGRTNGVKGSVWYSDSVASYGYTGHFDKGRAYWNATPEVNLWRNPTRLRYSDAYYVSSWKEGNHAGSNSYIYGFANGYQYWYGTDMNYSVGNNVYWDFALVRIYHGAMNTDGAEPKLNYYERIKVAAHEIGHSIKIAHPDDKSGKEPVLDKNMFSIMNQGRLEIMKPGTPYESITTYDKQTVTKKWGSQ